MSAQRCGPCPCACHKTKRVTIRQATAGRPGWAHGEFVPALLPASPPQDPARDQLDQAGLLRHLYRP